MTAKNLIIYVYICGECVLFYIDIMGVVDRVDIYVPMHTVLRMKLAYCRLSYYTHNLAT